MARLMNINLNLQHEYKKYNISHHLSFRSLDEVEKIHSEILSNNGSSPSLPCHSVVRVNMYDCSGTWCSFVLKEIHEVKWILRNNSFVSHCAKNKMGFRRQRGKVNLLWHVRSGDLCIRCKDTQYFDSLLQMIHSAVQSRAQTVTQLLNPYTVCMCMHAICESILPYFSQLLHSTSDEPEQYLLFNEYFSDDVQSVSEFECNNLFNYHIHVCVINLY